MRKGSEKRARLGLSKAILIESVIIYKHVTGCLSVVDVKKETTKKKSTFDSKRYLAWSGLYLERPTDNISVPPDQID